MHKIEIQGSGFPATNLTWRFLRDMINQVHNLAALGGDNYILSGCTNNGADVISDGWIVYQGELLPFTGGALGASVVITETIEQTTYLEDLDADGNGDQKDTYFTRVAQFGAAGGTVFNWSDLKRVTALKQQSTPVGGIIMWSGAINAIPAGWKLCDGTDGTPNLSGRFIVGFNAADADYDTIGETGGAKAVTLTATQMPQHNHSGNVVIPPHDHNIPADGGSTYSASGTSARREGGNNGNIKTAQNTQQSVSYTTGNKGGNSSHENRPPYFTLAYIIFIGV